MAPEQLRLYDAVARGDIREELARMGWTADGSAEPSKGALEQVARLSNRLMQVWCPPSPPPLF